jgi:hypothetical protein
VNFNLDIKSLIAVVMAASGITLYAETTYYKIAAAEDASRLSRLDQLYRDERECNDIKKKMKLNDDQESDLCKRVRREIAPLKEWEQQRLKQQKQ